MAFDFHWFCILVIGPARCYLCSVLINNQKTFQFFFFWIVHAKEKWLTQSEFSKLAPWSAKHCFILSTVYSNMSIKCNIVVVNLHTHTQCKAHIVSLHVNSYILFSLSYHSVICQPCCCGCHPADQRIQPGSQDKLQPNIQPADGYSCWGNHIHLKIWFQGLVCLSL